MSTYELRLFVAGQSERTSRSIAAAQQLCRGRLENSCRLTVVDVLEDPSSAEEAKIVATPTLIRVAPLPKQSVIGDLSDLAQVARILGLPEAANGPEAGEA